MKSDFFARELTADNFHDIEYLFGERGACGGCWCMSWRLQKKDFDAQKGEGNYNALKQLVSGGNPVGYIGYVDNKPVAWCSVSPRESFVKLAGSKIFKPVDDKPVWSITCMFINKQFRRQGLSTLLLKEVIRLSKLKGVQILEAYPNDPLASELPAAFVWTGMTTSFMKAGFEEAQEDRQSVR